MPTDIKLKNSVTATNAPTSLQQGEVAINITDKKVWVGNAATTPVQLLGTGAAGSFSSLTVSDLGVQLILSPSFVVGGIVGTSSNHPLVFVTNNVLAMTITTAGNVGIGTGSPSEKLTVSGNASLSGNLTFTGTGNRITGDFSNATVANRVMFQTSTTNGATPVSAIPNGTGTQANFAAYNASDPTNASVARMSINTTTDMRLDSSITGTGTYLPLTMYTGGSERLRIDTSGNCGIGTTSPNALLDVNGQATFQGSTTLANRGVKVGVVNINNNSADATVDFTQGLVFTSNASNAGAWTHAGICTTGGSGFNGNLIFGTDGDSTRNTTGITEKMRIDSSGNLLVGTTANPNTAKIAIGPTGGNGISIESNSTSVVMSQLLFRNPNGIVGSVTTSGSLTSYNISSDRRLKENIAPLTTGLASVLALKPSQYNYKADPTTSIQGFIADELQQIVPHAVSGEANAVDKDGKPVYQGVDASFLIPFLVSAIQELNAKITALENK